MLYIAAFVVRGRGSRGTDRGATAGAAPPCAGPFAADEVATAAANALLSVPYRVRPWTRAQDTLAVGLTVPLLPQLMERFTADPSTIGVVSSVYGFIQFFTAPVAGRMSDTEGRKRVLIVCVWGASIAYLLLGLASSLELLVMARFISGTFKHTQGIIRTTIAQMCRNKERATRMAHLNVASSLGMMVGSAAGGHLASALGAQQCALATFSLFILNFGFISVSMPAVPPRRHVRDRQSSDAVEPDIVDYGLQSPGTAAAGWDPGAEPNEASPRPLTASLAASLRTNAPLIYLLAFRFAMAFSVFVYRANFSLWLARVHGAEPVQVGYAISSATAVGTAASLALGRIRACFGNDTKLSTWAAAFAALMLALVANAPSVGAVLLFSSLLSAGTAVLRATVPALLAGLAGDHAIGRTLGFADSVTAVVRALAPALSGFLMQHVAPDAPVHVAAAMATVGIAISLLVRSAVAARVKFPTT